MSVSVFALQKSIFSKCPFKNQLKSMGKGVVNLKSNFWVNQSFLMELLRNRALQPEGSTSTPLQGDCVGW